jgi:glycosyltransferase involved in cell wall biosynthesis
MTVLSICIPTYNRAKLLRYCLDNLRALDAYDIDYEVVVVDHASTDETPTMLAELAASWDRLRFYRQTHAVGILRQFTGCFRMGRGTYTIYLADDDKIIAPQLVEYVRYMQQNPGVSVVYTPWLAYDDAEEKVIHGYFEVPQRTTFTAAQPLVMLDFMTGRMAFPEVAVYRSDALHAIMLAHQDGPYLAFIMAYALLQHGQVVFDKEPFYLEVAVTKPQFTGTTRMNIEINLTFLDNMRAGVEIMIERMLLSLGAEKIPDNLRSNVHEVLLNYAHNRLVVAFGRALSANQFVLASEIAHRVMLWRGIFQPDLPEISQSIYALTGIQAAAILASSKSWLKQIYICGFQKSGEVIDIMRKILPDAPIEAADAATILKHAEPDYVMVLVKHASDRTPFLNDTLQPGNIVALDNLAKYYQIIPANYTLDLL